MRTAADAAGCEAVLALAEVHETWHAYGEPEPYWQRRRGWDDDDDDEYGDGSPGEPELHELIESNVHLDRWLSDPDSPASPTSLAIVDDEVCATTPTVNLTPYASEYEGYMGNYGNTMDRWYRRAAIVVWPLRLAFAVRAEASPEWALDTLARQLRARDITGARTAAATLAPAWNRSAGATQRSGVLTKALRVARDLYDADLAAMLLIPFRVETLANGHAAVAARIVARYGEVWARQVVGVWFRDNGRWRVEGGADRRAWLGSLPSLCTALCAHSADGTTIAAMLAVRASAWLSGEIDRSNREATPSRRAALLGELGPSAAAVLASAAACNATDVRDGVLGNLSQDNDDLLACLLPALRSATALDPHVRPESGLETLARHSATRLTSRLARPTRAADDWSVTPPTGCSCALCTILATFLRDPTQRSYDWPLAEANRKHIHHIIDAAELPVRHQTRRLGRPYTLVLTKTEELFDRERRQREQDTADLSWLTATYVAGARSKVKKSRSAAGGRGQRERLCRGIALCTTQAVSCSAERNIPPR